MAVNLSALAGAGQQFFDNNGNPLSGGKLWSYQAGTTTPQTTYTTASGNVAHTNPIVLDSAGRVATGQIWLTLGSNYKFTLMTSVNVTLATWDNITGINGTGITSNASNVVYDPAGAGAVATTVQTKLRESVSVKDFGAVGDGVTDDTAAIELARDSGALDIYFPDGTYLVDTLTMSVAGQTWRLSAGATLKLANNQGIGAARVVHMTANKCKVIGGIIDGNKTNQTGIVGTLPYGVHIDNATNCHVENTWVKDCWEDGVLIAGNQSKVINLLVTGCDRNGVSLINANYCILDSLIVSGTGAATENAGIDIEPNGAGDSCSYNKVVNCTVRSYGSVSVAAAGIVILQTAGSIAEYNQIIGGSYTENSRNGILIIEAIHTQIESVVVTNNATRTGGTDAGITLITAPYTVINGVIVKDNGNATSVGDGIEVITSDHCVISGGLVQRNFGQGVSLRGSNNCVISGVAILSNGRKTVNTYSGVYLTTTSAIIPTGNVINSCRILDNAGSSGDQKYGIEELNGLQNSFVGNNLRSNRTGPILFSSIVVGTSEASNNGGYNPVGYLTAQPVVPASGAGYTNGSNVDCTVYLSGGAYSMITIAGTQIVGAGATQNTVFVPKGTEIILTYTSAPAWRWFGN